MTNALMASSVSPVGDPTAASTRPVTGAISCTVAPLSPGPFRHVGLLLEVPSARVPILTPWTAREEDPAGAAGRPIHPHDAPAGDSVGRPLVVTVDVRFDHRRCGAVASRP